jgi:Flp pilus assembly pilin Flp
MIEYSLLLALLSAVCVIGLIALRDSVTARYLATQRALQGGQDLGGGFENIPPP